MKRQEFHLIARGGVEWLECDILSCIPGLRHAFSTRVLHTGGGNVQPRHQRTSLPASLSLGYVEGERRARIKENRQLFFDSLGVGTLALAGLRQIHSSLVYRVRSESSGSLEYNPSGCAPAHVESQSRLPSGDALLTDQPGILLSVQTADCLPILLVDPARRAVAAVHAGWRGLLQRIAEKTVGEMQRVFHSRPEELRAAIGPSIRACCYEVGQEVVEAFRGRFTRSTGYFNPDSALGTRRARTRVVSPKFGIGVREPLADDAAIASRYPLLFLSARPPGRGPDRAMVAHLDLAVITRDQLQNAGVRSRNIYVADFCTACRTDLFFSHRKEGTTGRMMALIGMI